MKKQIHPQSKDPEVDPFSESTPVASRKEIDYWIYALQAAAFVLVVAVVLSGIIIVSSPKPGASRASTQRPIVSVTPTSTPEPTQTAGPMVVWTQTPTSTPEPTVTPSLTPTATRWPQPAWLTIDCLKSIQKIMQAELNGSSDIEALKFLATQLMYRATENNACVFPSWTSYSSKTIQPIVSAALNSVLTDWPATQWQRCQFVGSSGGYAEWKRRGMIKRDLKVIPFVADPIGEMFGVNCTPG